MSSRPSNSRISAATAPSSTPEADVTPYAPLEYRLTSQACQKLHSLSRDVASQEIDKLLQDAISTITDSVYQVNEIGALESLSEQDAQSGLGVDQKTAQLDRSIRNIIDKRIELTYINKALKQAKTQIISQPSSSLDSQLPRQLQPHVRLHRQALRTEIDDDSDDNAANANPDQSTLSPNSQGRPSVSSPCRLFSHSFAHLRDEYQSLSLMLRYSQLPAYVDFKNEAWSGKYPNDNGPPLPHADTWFASNGVLLPGVSLATNDEDEDLHIISATISTHCPLSLREIRDPLRSLKCPHHFDRKAITDFIQAQTRRNRSATVACPVGGCNSQLALSDLTEDLALARKIKRQMVADQKKAMRDLNGIDVATEGDNLAFNQIDDIDDEDHSPSTDSRPKAEIFSSRY